MTGYDEDPRLPEPLPPLGDWAKRGACRGKAKSSPNPWFPAEVSQTKPQLSDDGIAVCKQCPVIVECGQYATENNIRYGVWGGVPESQRVPKRRSGARKPKPKAAVA